MMMTLAFLLLIIDNNIKFGDIVKKLEIVIGDRTIGRHKKPFIIVEIGINHEGNYNKAVQMIKDAHDAGAECVKFQCHIVEDEMTKDAANVIPMNSEESIYKIIDRCALTEEEEIKLKKLTEDLGMIYLSTPFSRAAADRLNMLGVQAYKIGSGECNNYPLIEHIAKFGKPVILSTGMNNIDSITPAVKIFRKYNTPYALLHCTSLYPTPYNMVRLGAIEDLNKSFPDAILGLSDHSLGNYTCFASIPLGVSILEKHFTSNKAWPGPDIPISIDPDELRDLISGSMAIYESLGGTKDILKEEQPTIDFAYASVVAIDNIKKGDKLTRENVWVKRPGTGEILAKHYKTILGKTAARDMEDDSHLEWEDIV